jgi:short-subunit dehydrogenase
VRSKVLITGATGGLGKAFAIEGARRGWDLALSDMDKARLDLLAGGLSRTYGVEIVCHVCDLTLAEERASLLEALGAEGVRYRMLMNVAGGDAQGLFRSRSPEDIQAIVRLNIEATLDITRRMLELTDPMTPFRIITVASLAAFFPMPVKAVYAASKRFLLDFSLALREELSRQGATVTVLCPAGMPTNQACIDAIEAQGLGGYLTTWNVGAVAGLTIDRAMKGQAVVVPGLINQGLRLMGGMAPSGLVSAVIGSRWRKADGISKHDGAAMQAEAAGAIP